MPCPAHELGTITPLLTGLVAQVVRRKAAHENVACAHFVNGTFADAAFARNRNVAPNSRSP